MENRKAELRSLEDKLGRLKRPDSRSREEEVGRTEAEVNVARALYEQSKLDFDAESENDLNRDIRQIASESFKINADKNLGATDRRFFIGPVLSDADEEHFSAFQDGFFDMTLIQNFKPSPSQGGMTWVRSNEGFY